MSVHHFMVIAAIAAAGWAYLVTPPHRLRLDPASSSPSPLWLRLKPVLGAVEGAPTVISRLAAAVTLTCVGLVAGDELGVPAAGPAAMTLGVVTFIVLGRWRPAELRRRDSAIDADLPAACILLAVCLEAGLPLRNAVAAAAEGMSGPAAAALTRLNRAVRLGVPEPDAWAELGQRHPAFGAMARELAHAAQAGASLAPVLRHHAREAQRSVHAGAQARARRAGVRSVVPLMVCFLPAFILVGVVPIIGGVTARLFG